MTGLRAVRDDEVEVLLDFITASADIVLANDAELTALFETEDFAWITDELVKLAAECCSGRIVSTLEGGYDLNALAESATAHVYALQKG